ncbi:phage/plasmid primase, P4 family, partial [Brochothrix campestris]
MAQSNNPETWSDFDTALKKSSEFAGIGFMLGNGIFGVDIDNAKEDITMYLGGDTDNNVVSEFTDTLRSYAEYSVSNTGIHILCKGTLPEGGRRKGNYEFYEEGRFFVVTGHIVSQQFKKLSDCTEQIKLLHDKYIGSATNVTPLPLQQKTERTISLTESEVIEKALRSKTGKRFELCLNGGWDAFYSSQSEADLAFANDLAFWSGRDFSVMDSIFRSSSLMREKWDSKRKNTTYGTELLNKAIFECRNIYQPKKADDDFAIHVKIDEQKKKPNFFSYDDTGNADRFVEQYDGYVRYSYIDKTFYYYDGKSWQVDNTGIVRKMADTVVDNMKREKVFITGDEKEDEEIQKSFQKHIKKSRSTTSKNNILKEIEHRTAVLPEEFDSEKTLFNTQNGYLDLITGDLNDHDKDKLFTRISDVEYTNKIDCPQWMDFIDEIFDHDNELIEYVQKAVGYSLTGSTEEQSMFILFGNGRNGKSIFLETISDILGSYATNMQASTIMVKQNSGANTDIARLKGSRFVTSSEPNEGVRLDEGLVKQLTGGDKVTARQLYGKEFEFNPEFKLWLATNHKPIIRGTDDGIWRRLNLIPFAVQIPDHKVDRSLKYKLQREAMGILNWAVEGCLKWQKDGLKRPAVVEGASKEYREEMDATALFINECCTTGINQSVKAKTLYQAYREWASENGQYMMSNTKFGKEMGMKFA